MGRAESPGWFDVIHELARCHDKVAHHQLPTVVAFWIIWLVSVEKCSSLRWNLMQTSCSTCSVILNVTATQYTCSLNGIYCPHLTSTVFTHVHSTPLSLAARLYPCRTNHFCYINNGWTFSGQTSYITLIISTELKKVHFKPIANNF